MKKEIKKAGKWKYYYYCKFCDAVRRSARKTPCRNCGNEHLPRIVARKAVYHICTRKRFLFIPYNHWVASEEYHEKLTEHKDGTCDCNLYETKQE